jgi:multidrug efflux system membrane fusion protein
MRRVLLLALFLCAVAAAAFIYHSRPEWLARMEALVPGYAGAAHEGSSKAARANRAQEPAIPVVLAQAARKSVPVSFSTIGTIQPIASIALTSQVSGTVAAVRAADGAEVKGGDVLIEIDARLVDTQIEQAQATVAKDQASIEKAQRDLDRVERLLKSKFETPENVADAQTTLDLAKATLQSDQAALHNLQIQREYYTICAPVAGRIGTVQVKPGALVTAQAAANPIATLNSFDPIYVAAGIPQKMIAELAEDRDKGVAKVRIKVPGREDEREGPIAFIGNAAEQATGLITVMARIGNKPAVLWPGETVNVDVIFHDEPDALVVPGDAVATNQQGNYVYTVDDRGHAHLNPVVIARNVGRMAMVARGLNEGDKVVVDGQLQLSDGALVAVKQAMEGE